MDGGIIDNLKLSEYQVLQVVKEWYTNGMYPDILMDDNGLELDEICEIYSDALTRDNDYIDVEAYDKMLNRAANNNNEVISKFD